MSSESTEFIITSIFMITVLVAAVFGNALVIFAVLWNRRLRTIPNLLFLNLAVADMMQGAISIPLRVAEMLSQTGPLVPCLAVIPMTVFFYGASNLNLTLISIDRYFCLTRPFLYRTFVTPVKVGIVVAATWLLMLLIAMLPVMGWGATGDANVTDICLFYTTLTKNYLLMLFSVINIVVDIILVYTNFFILKVARKHIRQIQATDVQRTWGNSTTNEEVPTANDDQPNELRRAPNRRQENRRAGDVVLITVGAFIILTTPITVIDIIGLLGCPECSPLMLTKVAVGMVYSNACINVFIYAGYNKKMRVSWINACRQTRNAATGNSNDVEQDN